MRRNLVVMPYIEENRVVFIPIKMGDEFHFNFSPESFRHGRTWIKPSSNSWSITKKGTQTGLSIS